MARLLDIVFFIFFLTHIPITFSIDLQALIPTKYYPQLLVDLKEWYCYKFKDVLMSEPPIWFRSYVACEFLFQTPFFFVGAYGYFKGASKCKWLRIPAIIYGTHVATTLIPILAEVLFQDFSKGKQGGPQSIEERFTLVAFYLPYLIVPVCLVLDGVFSSAYTKQTGNRNTPRKAKAS